MEQVIAPFTHAPVPAVFGILAALAGFAGAYVLYALEPLRTPCHNEAGELSPRAMANRFYWDKFIRLPSSVFMNNCLILLKHWSTGS